MGTDFQAGVSHCNNNNIASELLFCGLLHYFYQVPYQWVLHFSQFTNKMALNFHFFQIFASQAASVKYASSHNLATKKPRGKKLGVFLFSPSTICCKIFMKI